jgi:transcriptional regulator with XRE-family HTH domain
MAGETLKRLRTNRGITVREVERASQRIVAAKSDRRFHISNGWLVQLENGASEPGICKLFTLSVIYNVSFLDLVRLYIDIDNAPKYRAVASSHRTQLLNYEISALPAHMENGNENHDTETTLVNGATLQNQGLFFPENQSSRGKGLAFGYIGLDDFTMYPLIRPGSVVKIDTLQRKLNVSAWRNEYERPIYFIELRNAYGCAWCELHDKDLLLIPHHSSPQTVRRFLFGREAEIIGRVIGFDTSCVDPEATRVRLPHSA